MGRTEDGQNMSTPQQVIFVGGKSYKVSEHSGYLKAQLNGYFGWTSVWANPKDGLLGLARRIKQVRSGGQ
jgi:hypothetical protein